MNMLAKLWFFSLLLVSGAASAGAETPCTMVSFPDGRTTVTLHDQTPKFMPLCYRFSAHSGQTAEVSVTDGDDMDLGMDWVDKDGRSRILGDSRRRMEVKTEDKDYRVYVGSRKLKDVDTSKVFQLTIELQ